MTAFLASTQATGDDALSPATLAGLCHVVGAEEAEYFELRRPDRAVLALVESHEFESVPGTDEALAAYGHQNPVGWRRWGPADGPMRLSARVSRTALQRTEFYNEGMRPNGLTDVLKVWLHRGAESIACVQLWLRGGTFTPRQEDMLGVLQSHLIEMRQAPSARAAPVGRVEGAMLTRREAEVLTWAVRGASDAEIASRLGLSVGTVGKHLEHAFAALGVHSRAAALWQLQDLESRRSPASRHARPSVVGSPGDRPA